MKTQVTEIMTIVNAAGHQLIINESLTAQVVSRQILAGSRIARCTYTQVVFSDCTFNSCEFQGVTFENCVFENCNFEFSHLRNCNFKNCSFTDCKWTASSSIDSIYMACVLSGEMEKACKETKTTASYAHDYTTDIYIELALVA